MKRTDLEAERDTFVLGVKRLAVKAEELAEEIESLGEDHPDFWTSFDVKRTSLDLKTAAALLLGVEDKLMQVGRWAEINKPGASWESVKARIKKR